MYTVSGVPLPVNIASSGLVHAVLALAPVSSGHQSTLCAPAASHASTSPAENSAPAGMHGTFVAR